MWSWALFFCSCSTEWQYSFVLKKPLCPQAAGSHPAPRSPRPCTPSPFSWVAGAVTGELGWRGWAEPLGHFRVQGSLSPSHELLCYQTVSVCSALWNTSAIKAAAAAKILQDKGNNKRFLHRCSLLLSLPSIFCCNLERMKSRDCQSRGKQGQAHTDGEPTNLI